MVAPDQAIVYFNPKAIAHNKLEAITKEQVYDAFKREDLIVFTQSEKLERHLMSLNWKHQNLLMMSSGNFNGLDFKNIIK